jgi:hypothetical protein
MILIKKLFNFYNNLIKYYFKRIFESNNCKSAKDKIHLLFFTVKIIEFILKIYIN